MLATQTRETQENIIIPSADLYSDEPPVETDLHLRQIILLLQCLEWWWRDRSNFFASGNITIYYSLRQKKSEDFRGPDFFVVLDTEKRSRKSWVVWEEGGKYPHIIVEILSPKTAKTDRETKKQIYQDIFRTPNYFWFDPDSLELAGFNLVSGKYQPIIPNQNGWMFSEQLGLYLGIHQQKLRFLTPSGELVPTPEEAAIQAEQRASKLAQKLRELGIDPEQIG